MKVLLFFFILILFGNHLSSQTHRKDLAGNIEVLDNDGKILEYHLVDANEKFRLGNKIAKIIYTYDSSNYLVMEKYLTALGKPFQYPSGVAMKKYVWNEARNILVTVNYDSLGLRTIDKKIEACIVTYKYDSSRKLKEEIFFSIDSTRINNRQGFSKLIYEDQVEKYYDLNDVMIKVINEETKFLTNLQLQQTSIPRWLRKADRRNKVNGIDVKDFTYELILANQKFDGVVQLSISIDKGDVTAVKFLMSENVSTRQEKKTIKAFRKAHFLSFSQHHFNSYSGRISIYFQR